MIINGILSVGDYWDRSWQMFIDIENLVKTTGKCRYYITSDGKKYKEFLTSRSEARRTLRFIIKYLEDQDKEYLDDRFVENPILYEIWEKITCTKKKK